MKRFIPRKKLGKKAQRQLDIEQRTTWAFSPVTKKIESKKLYNRKRKPHDRYDDYGMGFCLCISDFDRWPVFEFKTHRPIWVDPDSINCIIRVLCKKGMFDPFDDVPVEVSSSKNWQ